MTQRGWFGRLSLRVLTWSGSFTTTGTYYVVVEQAGGQSGTSYYLLEVEGDGVAFAEAAPADTAISTTTTTPAPASTESQPQSSLAAGLDGKLVFQTTYGGTFYTINADGGGLQPVTNGIDPVWSPDGEQIAFVSWEEPRGVWLVNADGSNAYRVFDWSEIRYPSWAPDGQEIVFSRQSGGGSSGFPASFPGMSADLASTAGRPPGGGRPGGSSGSGGTLGIVNSSDGTFWEPLPVSDTNLTPDWSPDGEQIILAGHNGLLVQSVDGQTSWTLTENPKDTSPVWSPDGEKVAFCRWQHDHWEIYVIDVTNGQQARLTDTPALSDGTQASSVSPAWSPDGNQLAFLTDRSGEWEIWVMAADGSNQGPMFGTELDGLALDYAYAGERAIDWPW